MAPLRQQKSSKKKETKARAKLEKASNAGEKVLLHYQGKTELTAIFNSKKLDKTLREVILGSDDRKQSKLEREKIATLRKQMRDKIQGKSNKKGKKQTDPESKGTRRLT